MSLITLATDFGTRDPFVGLMKGAILSIAPGATIVDLTHAIEPGDILAGALALEAVVGVFPPEAIHVGVVDPGVGSSRAAVALRTDAGVFVGPDNGLFTLALARAPLRRAVRLTNPRYHRPAVSATFHGRDIFAPVAAHLALGASLDDLGEPIDKLVTLDVPRPRRDGDTLILHVLHVDRFGNLITDLVASEHPDWLSARSRLLVGDTTIRSIRRTFADVAPGQPVAYVGSLGRLEIAVRDGSAAATMRVGRGETITLCR